MDGKPPDAIFGSSDSESDSDYIEENVDIQVPVDPEISRYPTRTRKQREIPGTIPWDALDLQDEH